jgi:hypothetical protein
MEAPLAGIDLQRRPQHAFELRIKGQGQLRICRMFRQKVRNARDQYISTENKLFLLPDHGDVTAAWAGMICNDGEIPWPQAGANHGVVRHLKGVSFFWRRISHPLQIHDERAKPWLELRRLEVCGAKTAHRYPRHWPKTRGILKRRWALFPAQREKTIALKLVQASVYINGRLVGECPLNDLTLGSMPEAASERGDEVRDQMAQFHGRMEIVLAAGMMEKIRGVDPYLGKAVAQLQTF